MRFSGMIASHLFEYFCQVTLDLRGSRASKQCRDRLFVGANIRRKPQRGTAITLEVICALVGERLTSKSFNELTKMDRVLMGIGPRPPSPWICAKGKDEEINHPRFIGFRRDLNMGIVIIASRSKAA